LTQLGLEVFAAETAQEYVTKAAALAGQIPSLVKLRTSLRQRMQASTLCDPERYAREVEAAYRHMWTQWCEQQSCPCATPLGSQ